MEQPGRGIVGREGELARVQSFIGSVSEGPSALLLEGAAGIGKTTLWHAGVSIARTRGLRVLSCRAAASEARLSYAALGDLFDFELPDLPAPQRRAMDAALLRAEVEGAPPDQRAVSVASLGVLRALATSGPVIVAIDDVQWLDAPSARVLAFVVRRLEDAPIRVLVALRVGSGGDPLGLGQTGPVPLRRVPIGPLQEEAMTRLLRDRTEGGLTRPVLLRLHRISQGNPLFALKIARALTRRGVRPAPGEPLPVPEDLQELLGARLAALPPSAADGLLVVAATARPTEDLVVAAAERRDWASAGMRCAVEAGRTPSRRWSRWAGWMRPKRSWIAWSARGEPWTGRGPSPPPGGAVGCSPRPEAICRRRARRWSRPWWSTGVCRSRSSWPGPCW